MHTSYYHCIVYVPLTHAKKLRSALADAGAGKIGNYDSCSFSTHGIGRFRPLKGANPSLGTIGNIKEVEEERIEVVVPADKKILRTILAKLKEVHPYEEPAIHLLPMMDYKQFLS